MKNKFRLDEDGNEKLISEEINIEEIREKNKHGVTLSIIWGVIIIIVVCLVYVMVRCGCN